MTIDVLANSPLINYFHYNTGELVGKLLDAGTIDFFTAADHTVRLSTFSDPEGTIVNPNPIILSPVGSAPIIYMQEVKYFIIIKDKFNNVIKTYDNYIPNGSSGGGTVIKSDENYITNGQFEYITDFLLKKDDTVPTKDLTQVAPGWEWWQDQGTTTKNVISFNGLTTVSIEANPLREITIDSSNSQTGEILKNLRQEYGNVTSFENETKTFSIQAINNGTGTVPVLLKLYKFYGDGGSSPEFITITSFDVEETRSKFSFSFDFPSNDGKTITDGNKLYFILSFPLNQSFSVGITNIFSLKGTVDVPIYPEQPAFIVKSKTLAAVVDIDFGVENFYYPLSVDTVSKVEPVSNTGLISLFTVDKNPFNTLPCDGRLLQVAQNTNSSIKNKRLFDVIGKIYGGSGDLVVTTKTDTVIFDSSVGAREKTAYNAGNLGTKVTITNTIVGLKGDVKAINLGSGVVQCTYIENFTPVNKDTRSLTFCGFNPNTPFSNQIKSTDVGSGPPAVFNIQFLSENIADYKTRTTQNPPPGPIVIDFVACLGWNISGFDNHFAVVEGGPPMGVAINFSVDGNIDKQLVGAKTQLVIPFKTSLSLDANVDLFVNSLSNPFEWTVKINAAPAASQYFEYSSDVADYYAWYFVDGAGTDPVIAGRTAVQVTINSTDATDVIATKTATATNSLEFNLPNEATAAHGLPVYQAGSPLVNWYIYL